MSDHDSAAQLAQDALDAHVRDIVQWHFSEETGTPHWLDWARTQGFDAIAEVRSAADLVKFPNFDDTLLRHAPHARFIPRALAGRPYFVFSTGGTTGAPKQRISFEDHLRDYELFSDTLDDASFPRGVPWLMVGPTGPRRLRLTIEHLAHHRGGICYFVDLDPVWVKRELKRGQEEVARRYRDHVIEQALTIIKQRIDPEVGACLFTTPRLLEDLGERISLVQRGIKGVFCGGTSITPQTLRFLVEEVLEGQIEIIPTYGNTLMGLARGPRLQTGGPYDVRYWAPQPRAMLRVVDPEAPEKCVPYGEWGRVELSTLTREFFMPRLLERDEAERLRPCAEYPWDGVGGVRPFRQAQQAVVEGVY